MNLEPWMPVITMVATAVLTGVGGVIAAILKQKYNIDLEKQDREALHSAIKTGVESFVQQSDIDVEELGNERPINDAKKEVVNAAIEYAKQSVPGALLRLNPVGGILADIALSKLSELVRR